MGLRCGSVGLPEAEEEAFPEFEVVAGREGPGGGEVGSEGGEGGFAG